MSTQKPIRYVDTFAGYGGFSLGIQRAFVDLRDNQEKEAGQPSLSDTGGSTKSFSGDGNGGRASPTCIGFSEVNKYAIQVYEKHFPYEECENCRVARNGQEDIRLSGRQETLNSSGTHLSQAERPDRRSINGTQTKTNCECKHKPYGDITQINPSSLPDFDLLTGGFPCQAFSIAGKRQGFNDTRGTLFFDIARILKEKRPRNFILENVKGLLSHDNGRTFKTIITTLVELGYCVEWQVINAKDYVPQNRERVFIVGHLGGVPERKVFPLGESGSEIVGVPQSIGERPTVITSTITTENAHGFGKNVTARQAFDIATLTGNIRRLTPKECERLMGLEDDWTAEGTEGRISDSQRYKLCGNGVVVNVVEAIVRKLYEN